MGISIVLKTIVPITGMRLLRCQTLKPNLKIMMEASLVVVDKNARCNVHGVTQKQALLDTAFSKAGLDLGRDVDKLSAVLNLKH
jgi:hypothetical protein